MFFFLQSYLAACEGVYFLGNCYKLTNEIAGSEVSDQFCKTKTGVARARMVGKDMDEADTFFLRGSQSHSNVFSRRASRSMS